MVSSSAPSEIATYFDAVLSSEQLLDRPANFNVAPTSSVLAVRSDGANRSLDGLRWGLVPTWADDIKIGSRMINARAESVAKKPSFRSAFKRRRCIIAADGFYEWKLGEGVNSKGKPNKQPYFIHRPDGEPYAFAGLWETWRGPKDADGDVAVPPGARLDEEEPYGFVLETCTILTGEPNERMSELHDRMPVILSSADWDEWLDPSQDDTEALHRLLAPAPSSLIEFHPVSTEVNNARHRGAHLTDPVELPEASD